MSALTWTEQKPTAAGWYWFRGQAHEADPFIVEVDHSGQFQWPDGGYQEVRWPKGNGRGRLLASATKRSSLSFCWLAARAAIEQTRESFREARAMGRSGSDPIQRLMNLMFKAHPWHGVSMGDKAPEVVTAYIEIVPTDTVKYEVDKDSGFLKVDRPQRFSNVCPVYYGLVPQTYCGEKVVASFSKRAKRKGMVGDRDPLDICVLTEKTIAHSDILLTALPIGGFSMADGGEADDKIIAVMKDDAVYGDFKDIADVPITLIDRLQHYFLTYKQDAGSGAAQSGNHQSLWQGGSLKSDSRQPCRLSSQVPGIGIPLARRNVQLTG